jgi:serine/threonine protein kinase/Tol biopolymer transport system component
MDEVRWQRAKQLFHEALEKTPRARAGFVAGACGDDEELRAQVDTLLAAHAGAGEFMARPTGGGSEEDLKATAPADPQEGPSTRIGPYKLLQPIGEGGMGVVYMAEQEHPIRRRVALKIIKLGLDTRAVIARFEAERQALALMEHPGIAKVLDAGATESGRPYFVMELVRGMPITEYCDANRSSTRERLELFMEVCRAIHHAHEKGVVHRDIKPSNVLVTQHDGVPAASVIDFGIAKAMNQPLTEKTLFTAFGEFAGTPAYMSPEQAALGGHEIDRRCDIYALGVLLYELLTGTTPFEPERLRSRAFLEIMRIIREEDPPVPSARLSTLGDRLAEVASRRRVEPHTLTRLVRGDLDWIVARALEKDRRRRYDSAVALADDIGRHFRHEPVTARRPSVGYRLQKLVRRRRGRLVASAAVLGAIIAGGAIARMGGVPASGPGLTLIEPRLTQVLGSDTLQVREAALSPDGSWVAFTVEPGIWGGSLWVVPADGGTASRLIDEPRLSDLSWFPDGNRIAYYAWGADTLRLFTVPFDGRLGQASGPPQLVAAGMVTSPRVSPDGNWIAYLRWDSESTLLKVVPALGGSERTVYRAAPGVWPIWLVDWSVDGRHLYFHQARASDSRDEPPLFRVSADEGAPEEVTAPPAGASAPRASYWLAMGPDASFEVRTHADRRLARISLPRDTEIPSYMYGRSPFSPDGRRLLTVATGSAWTIRTIPLGGGAPRQVGETRRGDELWGWTPDGAALFLDTRLEGRRMLMRVRPGGAAREIGAAPDRSSRRPSPLTFSADGQFLAYSRTGPGQPHRTLVIRPAAGGRERVVTRALYRHWMVGLAGPGGTPNRAGADFLYEEVRDGRVELRAIPPNGPSRVLRTFPLDERRPRQIGVFGARVAWQAEQGSIMVADGRDGAAKEVVPAYPDALGYDDVVWSHDGRWIAATAYVGRMPADYTLKVLVVGVTPEGEVSSPARLLDTPIIWMAWGLQWVPDGSAVLVTGMSPPHGRFDAWLVPVDGQRPPVAVTSADQDFIDGYTYLSPDGQHIVYQARAKRGSSIWLAELGDVLSGLRPQ